MFVPPPVAEKVPAAHVVRAGRAGVPTSCADHGAGRAVVVTVKSTPLLATLLTLTTTLPVVAPAGTAATMLIADQLVVVAVVPLKVTVLVPFVAPKLVPVIVTAVATGPLV